MVATPRAPIDWYPTVAETLLSIKLFSDPYSHAREFPEPPPLRGLVAALLNA